MFLFSHVEVMVESLRAGTAGKRQFQIVCAVKNTS